MQNPSYTYGHIVDMHGTGTKHKVRHRQKSVVQWSFISKFACIINLITLLEVFFFIVIFFLNCFHRIMQTLLFVRGFHETMSQLPGH